MTSSVSKGQNPKAEALDTIIERLQKSLLELFEENEGHSPNTKGKAKATEQDDEREVEFRRKIEYIDNAILHIRDSAQDDMYRVTGQPINATFDHDAGPMSTSTSCESGITVDLDEEEEPIWNPFTSSYAYRETGSEPGPSGLSRDSIQLRQNLKQEREVLTDASPEIKNNFAEYLPLWMQYSGQPQLKVSKHIPTKPVELDAGNEPLRGDPPPSTEPRELTVQGLDSRDDLISRISKGKLAFVGNVVQSCRKWLFKRNSAANGTNQGVTSRIKSPSRLELSSCSKSPVTSFGTSLSPASLAITDTPRSSVSLQRVKTKTGDRRLPFHSDSIRDFAKRQVRDVSPRPASFVFPYDHDSTSISETLRQRLSKSLLPQPQSLPLQHQEDGSYQERYTPEQQERGMQQTWSKDESFLLALAFEEDKARFEEHELSHRLAMRLQLQEDREVAEREEMLEMEWLQEGRRLQEAVLETERRSAAEAEHLQQELQAQEAVLQADAELAARLNDVNRAIWSDRKVAEQLQAELERETAAEHPSTEVRNSTQQSQSQILDDRAFAQILQEEEETRAAEEEKEALIEITTWQKEAEQGVDRRQRRSRTVPPKANASSYAWTTQPDQAQASQGFQAIPRTVPAPDDLNAEGECLLCTDSFPKSQLVRPCEHFYCQGCVAGKTVPLSFQKPCRLGLTA